MVKYKRLNLTQELLLMEGFSDSTFGEYKETRLNVYGYVLYLCGAPVVLLMWCSSSLQIKKL
jgi:hypothetical protein